MGPGASAEISSRGLQLATRPLGSKCRDSSEPSVSSQSSYSPAHFQSHARPGTPRGRVTRATSAQKAKWSVFSIPDSWPVAVGGPSLLGWCRGTRRGVGYSEKKKDLQKTKFSPPAGRPSSRHSKGCVGTWRSCLEKGHEQDVRMPNTAMGEP